MSQHILRKHIIFSTFLEDVKRYEASDIFKDHADTECRYSAIGRDPQYGIVELRFIISKPRVCSAFGYYRSWKLDSKGNSILTSDKKKEIVGTLHEMGAKPKDLAVLNKIQASRLKKLCETEEETAEESKASRFEETTDKKVNFSVPTELWGNVDIRVLMSESFGSTSFRYELLIPPIPDNDIVTCDKVIAECGFRLCQGQISLVDQER